MGKIMKMLELPGETVFRETQVIICMYFYVCMVYYKSKQ